MAELIFRDYQAIGLNVKPKALAKQLDKKSGLLADATNVYIDVVEFGDAQWGTAALYRIGSMYEQFSTELREAPAPPDLTEDEQVVYREQLDIYVVQIEDKAVEAYETGYSKALTLKVYNEYTRKLREALGRLAESRYPRENEARTRSRIGDRPPAPQILKDVVRSD
jgi:hypothetical protein